MEHLHVRSARTCYSTCSHQCEVPHVCLQQSLCSNVLTYNVLTYNSSMPIGASSLCELSRKTGENLCCFQRKLRTAWQTT